MRHRSRRADAESYFEQADGSAHMLGLPSARPRLGKWGVAAVVVGVLLAGAVIAFENYVASLPF